MKDYSIANWNNLFLLSPESPSGLVWKIKSNNRNPQHVGTKYYDSRSGSPDSWRVSYRKMSWLVHRIILTMQNIDITDKIVDHMDGNPFNNELLNLRATTQSINCQNRKIQSNNLTGIVGVHKEISKGYEYFRASYCLNGKEIRKRFSILKFGNELAFQMACEYRDQIIEYLNKNGHCYTDRHGSK